MEIFAGKQAFFSVSTIQCEAPKIVKLVQITPISLWFMVLITIVTGAYKPTYNWGASHCRLKSTPGS